MGGRSSGPGRPGGMMGGSKPMMAGGSGPMGGGGPSKPGSSNPMQMIHGGPPAKK